MIFWSLFGSLLVREFLILKLVIYIYIYISTNKDGNKRNRNKNWCSITISFARQRALEFENLNVGSSGLKFGSSSRETIRASWSSIPRPPIRTDPRGVDGKNRFR